MKKSLFVLLFSAFLIWTTIFAKDADQLANEWSELWQLLVQRIKEWKLTFDTANYTITYWIDYYLDKLRKWNSKLFDNLSLFSIITADLKNYDATLSKPSIASWTVMPVSYTPSDFYFYDSVKATLGEYSSNATLPDNSMSNIIIPPEGSQIYSVRANVKDVTKIPQLKIFANYKDRETTVSPTLVYYYKDSWEKLFKPEDSYSSRKSAPSFTSWTVIYIYADVHKDYKDLSLWLTKDDTVSLSSLTLFKYSMTKVTDELERELWYIPFCISALSNILGLSEDVPYYHCKFASMWSFSEWMNSMLFYEYNKTHNYEYESKISTSYIWDMYCKSTKSTRTCLWIDEWKITNITEYKW